MSDGAGATAKVPAGGRASGWGLALGKSEPATLTGSAFDLADDIPDSSLRMVTEKALELTSVHRLFAGHGLTRAQAA